jgi:hypothetical protein|tara:strand:- start:96 stop:677 length:582 start_codon:yes stop_codon:yes gene_type:complete
MKKNILSLIILFVTFNSFSQDIIGKKSTTKPYYSENSEIKVIYKDSLDKFHSKNKPAGVFVNGIFIGNQGVLNVINSDKIESLNIEKEYYEKNGKEYYGKILVKMKPEYIPKFITAKDLITKYLDLDTNPIIFQINENVTNQYTNENLIDENFILKIELTKIKTSEKDTELNLIKIITKTTENIKEANIIRIK